MTFNYSRRQFLAFSSAVMAVSFLPRAWGNTTRVALPVPPLIDGSNGQPVDLKIRHGQWSFQNNIKTDTLGFNQDYLGPTIRARKGSDLHLRYQNGIDEAVAVHGHGLHVPGEVDGGPQLIMQPGESWHPVLPMKQQAATCWYHSHTHGKTGEQVYRGLAGMMIIDDENSDQLDLPDRYGIDDLPVIIQDRTFTTDGQLKYSLQDAGEDGWFGDTVVINGAVNPVASVPQGKVRLRILNGANARFYILRFADNRTFYKIATEGGFLEKPVALDALEMSPGERCEIIVDLSDGKTAGLLTLFEDDVDEEGEGIISSVSNWIGADSGTDNLPAPALTLVPDSPHSAHTRALPGQMNSITRPAPEDIAVTRELVLTMEGIEGGIHHGGHGSHADMTMGINGMPMDMAVINERVQRGVWERWKIRADMGEHPFHIHGCSFLIESIAGEAVPPEQQGWKDMVTVDDDGWSEVLVRFDELASDKYPYMYHCHILEHEDLGMMGQFTVTA